jgi:hypothetical protein
LKDIGESAMEKMNRYGQAAKLSRPHSRATMQHLSPLGKGDTDVF